MLNNLPPRLRLLMLTLWSPVRFFLAAHQAPVKEAELEPIDQRPPTARDLLVLIAELLGPWAEIGPILTFLLWLALAYRGG